MKRAAAFAAVALFSAVPTAPLACEAPGRPCPAVEVCDTADCDGPNDPPPPPAPAKRCEEPRCDGLAKPACEGAGCGRPEPKAPETKRPDPPGEPGQG